ncbi:uncharacterized protein LOC134300286 [Trichomycterus rosablanca]|uniref:uncharacterized protein LOC134300286 n=1 Tax=Trichomycterus rosablanca TaxID=2290929 RepID=UPI002F3592B0
MATGLGVGGLAPGLGLTAGLGADAKSAKYGGAGAGAVIGATAGQPVVSAGLGTAGKAGGYAGAPYVGQTGGLGAGASLGAAGGILEPVTDGIGQLPFNGAAGLDGDVGYQYGPQPLSLGGDGGKLGYGDGRGYGVETTGLGAALGVGGQGSYTAGGKDPSKYGAAGYYGTGVKG